MPHLLSPADVEARQSLHFSINKFSVDQETGDLKDVALLTAGREAKGHGIYIDQRTLETAKAVVQEKGGRLRGRVCHETMREYFNDEDGLLEVPGFFSGIEVAGDKLVSRAFEWFETFRADEPKAHRRLVEMAAKTPDLFGISIEPYGYAVYVDEEGNEYGSEPDGVELLYSGMPALRVTALRVAAFVSDPAANDNLFALAAKKLFGGKQLQPAEAQQLGAAFADWAAKHPEQISLSGVPGQIQAKDKTMNELLKKLQEKFGEDKARLSQAQLIVVNHSDPENLSVDAVEALLDKADLAKLRADNAELQTKLDAAAEADKPDEAAKLRKEKEELEARLKKKEGSGSGEPAELGAPAIVGGGFKFSGRTAKLIELGQIPAEKVDVLKKKFAAGTTSVSDLWTPEIYQQGMAEAVVEQPSLLNSGIVARTGEFDALASGGGVKVNLPFFQEPDFASLLQVESTAPTTQKMSSGSQIAPVLRRVSPIGFSSLAGAITNSDPFGYIMGILTRLRNRQDQTTLISALRGFFGDATVAAALSEDQFTEDVAGDGLPTHVYDSDIFADAVARLGEAAQMLNMGAMVVHSKIHAAMIKQDDVEDIKDSEGNIVLTRYRGRIPLFISDALSRAGTTNGTVYETIIAGPRTVAFGAKSQSGEIGDSASILVKGDEGTNDRTIYDRRQFIVHPSGAKYVGTPADAKAGPTDTELATAADWDLGFSDAKNVGILRIRTNG